MAKGLRKSLFQTMRLNASCIFHQISFGEVKEERSNFQVGGVGGRVENQSQRSNVR